MVWGSREPCAVSRISSRRRGAAGCATLKPGAAIGVAWVAVVWAPLAGAQHVAVDPLTTTPAAWERFAVRVANAGDTAIVAVHVAVPGALAVLGVEPVPGFAAATTPATDSTPAAVTWRDGSLARGEFREFAFLGRVAGDARPRDLVLLVRTTPADGEPGPARRLTVRVIGRARLSPGGVTAIASAALGTAVLALVVMLARQTRRE
jgi:uncharacterized protein YcnI